MKRVAIMMAVAAIASTGVTRAAQEKVAVPSGSPVQGGKVNPAKTSAATGVVKTVTADTLTIKDADGKDWAFVIDASTKIALRAAEKVDVPSSSAVKGGKVLPSTPASKPEEKVAVAPASPVEGGKVLPSKAAKIADVKEGQRVQVTYRTADGKMHATQVRVM
jgi:hypothetical protein